MEEINNEKKNKKIEIVKGKKEDLKISEVKDSLSFEINDDQNKKKNVIIPKSQNH